MTVILSFNRTIGLRRKECRLNLLLNKDKTNLAYPRIVTLAPSFIEFKIIESCFWDYFALLYSFNVNIACSWHRFIKASRALNAKLLTTQRLCKSFVLCTHSSILFFPVSNKFAKTERSLFSKPFSKIMAYVMLKKY